MEKINKIKELKKRLADLAQRGGFDNGGVSSLTDSLIKEEMANVSENLKNNPTIRALQKIDNEISQFKEDFNFEPLIDLLQQVNDEISANQKSMSNDFETRIAILKKNIDQVRIESIDTTESKTGEVLENLTSSIEKLRGELTSQIETTNKTQEPLYKSVESLGKNLEIISKQITDSATNGVIVESTYQSQIKEINNLIEKTRQEFLTRIAGISGGGGNMNRKITVEGATVLTKYTDVNFYGVTSSVITSVDNTNKRVNIGIQGGGGSSDGSLTVGVTSIASGTTTRILYDNAGALGEYTLSGLGTVVPMQTSPTLITPFLGVASVTSLNKVTITQPATSAVLTIADGKTLTSSFNSTFNGADQTFTGSGTAVTTFLNENNSLIGVVGSDRKTAQTAAVALATYTVGAADATFFVSANVNVTTATTHSFTVTCAYTDETNAARTLTFGFTQLSGATLLTAITNITGAGPYESFPIHIRCKAATTIVIASAAGGTYTTVTYNIEERIIRAG